MQVIQSNLTRNAASNTVAAISSGASGIFTGIKSINNKSNLPISIYNINNGRNNINNINNNSRNLATYAHATGGIRPKTLTPGYLVLEDGSIFRGHSFGAEISRAGEAVFNTGMVGYPESLSDPSYRGQILTFTYPSIGNYGIPPHTLDEYGLNQFFESSTVHPSGVIVADYSWEYSHWNAVQSLSQWLIKSGVPALAGIDTRLLTKKLRENGAMLGKIIFNDDIPFEDPNQMNLVDQVSTKVKKIFGK